MPPQRGPINTKALKTERTHEENQERAYIAASRRSDRSLEARIESARRASEIHKKRTGRSLRVTEQDVINEEMYEEEDDDLQSQYRRLQAHLGNSADLFNGRLNSWILSQFGTRQMAAAAAAAQGPMGFNMGMPQMPQVMTPFFAYNPPASPAGTLSPQLMQRGHNYRQSPYPPQRNSLANTDPAQQAATSPTETPRRHSLAGGTPTPPVPGTPQTDGSGQMRPPTSRAGSTVRPASPADFFNNDAAQFQTSMASQMPMNPYTSSLDAFSQMQDTISPLTTALPMETQQMIGSSFEPNNPWTSYFMTQASSLSLPSGLQYSYNPNVGSAKCASASEGINQTLSPNPLMSPPPKVEAPALSSADATSASAFDSGFGLGFSLSQSDADTAANPLDTPSALDASTYFSDWIDASTHEDKA